MSNRKGSYSQRFEWLTRSIGDSANEATHPVNAPATKYSKLFSRLPIRCGPLRMLENCTYKPHSYSYKHITNATHQQRTCLLDAGLPWSIQINHYQSILIRRHEHCILLSHKVTTISDPINEMPGFILTTKQPIGLPHYIVIYLYIQQAT